MEEDFNIVVCLAKKRSCLKLNIVLTLNILKYKHKASKIYFNVLSKFGNAWFELVKKIDEQILEVLETDIAENTIGLKF